MKKWLMVCMVIFLGIMFISASQPPLRPMRVQPPLYFISNQGQVHETAVFYAKTPGYTLWMTKEGLTFDSIKTQRAQELKRDVSRFLFLNANKNPEMVPLEPAPYKVNYLKGDDRSQWKTGIHTSKAVLYKNLYKNIDLKIYGISKQVEYDWMVKPDGDPRSIRFQYKNVKNTCIDEAGNILIETQLGKLTHKRPISYQYVNNCRKTVKAIFKKVGENTYGFEVGAYDKDRELIIDPVVMTYATFLGGSGNEHGFGLTVDSGGSAYVTGDTYSTDYPTVGGYQNTFGGDAMDAFVTKFSSSGTSLVYSTFLGGSGNDTGESIRVDDSGKAYITGLTLSTDFPVKNPYQATHGGGDNDVFVCILSSSGSSLHYSTYLGGSGDDIGFALALDGSMNIYITGRTGSTDFPTQNAYKDTFSGSGANEYDAFVTKIDSDGSSLSYSTYLGGSSLETAYGIVVSGSNAYVGGRTTSTNFPTTNAYQSTHGGSDYDAFLTKFSSTGGSLIYSTYLGGNGTDSAYSIAVDGSGNAYLTGDTRSSNFPTKNPYQSTHAGGDKDVFVAKFASSGTTLEYATYLGGTETDGAADIAVDDSGQAYITGSTMSSNFPVKRAYQEAFNGDFDVFVSMLSTIGDKLIFSSYLGGGDRDVGRDIALDAGRNIYVTGDTQSVDFPTVNPYQDSQNSDKDAFLCKISTEQLGNLCGAVDNCGLNWSTGGAGDWLEQTDTYYYDDDAAQSGAIGNGQSSYLRTTVTGPALLTFWWKVLSEQTQDYLTFYIDDVQQDAISGEVDWVQESYTLTPGSHTLQWTYSKDPYCCFVYPDAGWIDKVEISPIPEIVLDRDQLTFGAVSGNNTTGSQTVSIGNNTNSTLHWTASPDQYWVTCSPTSGTDAGIITVMVDAAALTTGTHTASISVSDPYASNSPQTVTVTLNVYQPGGSSVPFGSYATPIDGSTISSSVPFTGWVLDDVGVESVKLYRHDNGSQLYIGDAVFVEGARPDVEQAYPGYPYNYKSGWGYMMLTHFLPNGGNGTFTIEAIAVDLEGNQASLGTKTVTVNNADAVKPFGAIDTPTQGGTASETDYRNQGWVLTPQPNTVPTDGSTIKVYVDGVLLGTAVYNLPRTDIATYFPGYNNSNGALAYYDLDTTAYSDGIHTIQWVATDDAGNSDGIGSRYFMIQNSGNREQAAPVWLPNLRDIPVDYSAPVEIKELERIEIRLSPGTIGFHLVGDQLKPLPIGSTMDTARGIFYWQPGAGFTGEYRFIFIERDPNGNDVKREILITIRPKH